MERVLLVRAGALYVPVMLVLLAAMRRLRTQRHIGAMLVGSSWAMSSLLLLQLLNLRFHWWSFHAEGGLLRGMPVDLYLGWALLWGALPIVAFPQESLWLVITLFFIFDLAAMPLCTPVVKLGRYWLAGEGVAILLALAPAQLFSRWTFEDSHLRGRAALHVISAGLLFLFVLPEGIFAILHRGGWAALIFMPAWLRSLELQAVAILGAGGVSAAQEFASRGLGTPIPFDPPKRLVTSGLYRYVANPMQVSCALVFTAWGALLRNPWLFVAALITLAYGAGLAHWDEGEDMRRRFGSAWERYRRQVRAWRPRWRPWHDPAAPIPRLYIAESCGQCSEVRRWLELRRPVGLEIVAAEKHPRRSLLRMTYDPMDGSEEEEGVAALARGLEHLHLGWAYIGACMRLPLVRPILQLLLDASGLGPRLIPSRALSSSACDLPAAK